MIQGRRLGRPLLGKWHLRSFVVSVIGLSTLSADSSPREAPPACQLHSIREPWLLLFTVQAPSSTLLCLLIYIPLNFSVTFPALLRPQKDGFHHLSFLCYFCIFRSEETSCFFILLPPCFFSSFLNTDSRRGCWLPLSIPFFIFLFMSLCVSFPLLSSLSPPNKHLCRPPLPNLFLLPLKNSSGWSLSCGWEREGGRGAVSFVKLQNSTPPLVLGTRTQAQLELSRKAPQSNDGPPIP